MNTENVKYVYLIGIGGIGMSALARFFKAMGKEVSGYDKTPTPLTQELESEGIAIHFKDDKNLLPAFIRQTENMEEILVIYTPAIPKDHLEMNFIREKGFHMYKRSQVLGLLTKTSFTVAVAGTHGKTTTSSIVAHLFKTAEINCTAFLGGISVNYNSNLLLGKKDKNNSQVIVVEADEFDRSFLALYPDLAIITSLDADHLDIYGDKAHLEESYRLFADQVKPDGLLFYKAGLPLASENHKRKMYSIDMEADIKGENIRVAGNRYYFDLKANGVQHTGFSLGIPGRHNVENAVAAIAIALEMNISIDKIKTGLVSYRGVKRRFEYHIQQESCTYIDDYAHHPEELRAAISSVKELFPGKKVTGIFQPHLYSRTRDFADDFAKSLSLLDELILLDIYPARELPLPGVTSAVIYDKVSIADKTLCRKDELLKLMENKSPEILITLGAGDIDQFVYPIRNLLLKKIAEHSK